MTTPPPASGPEPGPSPRRDRDPRTAVTLLHLALLVCILCLGLGLRLAAPGADPPLSLSRSNSEVMDGPWYLAAAVDAARGRPLAIDRASYDRPLFTLSAKVAFSLAGGVSLEAAQALAAAWGALLVLGGALAAYLAFGTRAALLAALLLATSFIVVGYGRVPLVYGPLAALSTLALALHMAGLRRTGPGAALCHALAVLAVLGAGVGVKESAVTLLPGIALGCLCASRHRTRDVALLALLGGLGALLAWHLGPESLRAAAERGVDRLRGYLGSASPLEIAKRTLNAPLASGLATGAPVLLALAWLGALLPLGRLGRPPSAEPGGPPPSAPAGSAPSPDAILAPAIEDERRRAAAPEAACLGWLLATILLHAPLRFDPQEGGTPLRHFAPALVPAALLAARLLDELWRGAHALAGRAAGGERAFRAGHPVRLRLHPAVAALWGFAGAYVALGSAWTGLHGLLGGLPASLGLLYRFEGILASAAIFGAFPAILWLGRGRASLAPDAAPTVRMPAAAPPTSEPAGVAVASPARAPWLPWALLALTLAADAALLTPALLRPTHDLRDANALIAQTLPRQSVVAGPFAHALTYTLPCTRRFPRQAYRPEELVQEASQATHLAVDAAWGPEVERIFRLAREPLTPVVEVRIRGYPVRVYAFRAP